MWCAFNCYQTVVPFACSLIKNSLPSIFNFILCFTLFKLSTQELNQFRYHYTILWPGSDSFCMPHCSLHFKKFLLKLDTLTPPLRPLCCFASFLLADENAWKKCMKSSVLNTRQQANRNSTKGEVEVKKLYSLACGSSGFVQEVSSLHVPPAYAWRTFRQTTRQTVAWALA